MQTSGLQQNVFGTDSNVGFFFGGWSTGNLTMVQVGWYAQGHDKTGLLFNGRVTYIDVANQTITIENTQQFKPGRSYYFTSLPITVPCFKEDTKILCLKDNEEKYVLIQDIKPSDLVKTTNHGYLRVNFIGSTFISNPDNTDRIINRLYKCSKENYNELREDLYITGGHSILVDELTDEQIEKIERTGEIQKTDAKYRLMSYMDTRTEPYNQSGLFKIYHIALENEDHNGNYGIYANGLLVETCSLLCLVLSNMEIIE